ncbi:MAG TPA: ATP-dependent helicase [Steroidobacteraceae bacterium]|nr:ATP-dependent helicase [Steroidobacteraceae bacterium]HNS27037.1 ATP-dependent helicase [Steroidobacteraceae bacterium]
MSTTAHLAKLNVAQRKAVTYGEPAESQGYRSGPLLIIAGAGTGKTSTLAHRVAHLAMHGVDPARILMLTFTRRAALEMRRRAHEVAKAALNDVIGGVSQTILQRLGWAGTFHSVGNRLLRHYARHLGLDPQFSVIDRADSADLIDGIRQELGFASKEQRFPRKDTCLAIYSYRVNTQLSLEDSLERQFPWCGQWADELTKLFRTYVERKQKFAILDYDDLLLYWHILMSEPKLAQHVATHFDHVLVDEYQDTNRLQAEILYGLCPDGNGLTVVGDDAQAIYSFRAATVENILEFPEHFQPRAEIVALAQNYRSTQAVLDVSNALMAEAPRQFRKHLLSLRGSGSRPRLVTVEDLPTQAEYVCTQVLKAREANVPLRRQAVLFRSSSHSDLLEVQLSKRKIPFIKYGGLKFLEAAHVKDLLGILRWIDNPRNAMAGFRVLQLLKGMGPANARRALDHLLQQGGSFESLRSFEPPADSAVDWRKLVDLLVTLADPQQPWTGQVNQVRNWYRPHLERLYEHVHTRIGDLDQLELLAGQYPSRERFITELTLDPPQASGDLAGQPLLDEDYLVLSTVHSAKGMEWDTVYVLNVVDGSFPSEFATGRAETIEEERRLLYVAMTRAKDDLMLVQPLKFPLTHQPKQGDAHVYGGRSRFLTEKVLKTLEATTFQGSNLGEPSLGAAGQTTLDAVERVKSMW